MKISDISPTVFYVQETRHFGKPSVSAEKKTLSYKFMLVTGGECTVRYGGNSVKLFENDIIFMPPETVYSTEVSDGFGNINVYFGMEETSDALSLSGRALISFDLSDKGLSLIPIQNAEEFSNVFYIRKLPAAAKKFYSIASEYKKESKFAILAVRGELCRLIADSAAAVCGSVGKEQKAAESLEGYFAKALSSTVWEGEMKSCAGGWNAAEDTLRSNSCTPTLCTETPWGASCADIAAALGYHPNYLNAVAKSRFGMTFHKYVEKKKIAEGARLLLSFPMNVTEIAYALGYCGTSHFCRSFKKIVGETPLSYRKNATP